MKRCIILLALAAALSGCGRVGKSPLEGLGAFAIPHELTDTNAPPISWLFFVPFEPVDRRVSISIDGKCIFRNKLPPDYNEPPIQSLPQTHFVPGPHSLTVQDLHTGECVTTNLTSGSTEQIEIRFEPLSVGVYSNVTWGYL